MRDGSEGAWSVQLIHLDVENFSSTKVPFNREHLVMVAAALPDRAIRGGGLLLLFHDHPECPSDQSSSVVHGKPMMGIAFKPRKGLNPVSSFLTRDEGLFPSGRRGTSPRAESKDMHVEIAHLLSHIMGGLEILLGLSGKATDDVGRDGGRKSIS